MIWFKKNKDNINFFVIDFKNLNTNNFQYVLYCRRLKNLCPYYRIIKMRKFKSGCFKLPSFLSLQKYWDDSGLEVLPQIEVIQLVASSQDLLNNLKPINTSELEKSRTGTVGEQ